MAERHSSDELTDEEKIKFLNKGEYLILATVDCEGEPYGAPLNYIVKDHFDFSDKNKVSFNAVGNTTVLPNKFGTLYKSIIVAGEASLVDDQKEKYDAFREFFQKYSSAFITECDEYIKTILSKAMVIRISIKSRAGDTKNDL